MSSNNKRLTRRQFLSHGSKVAAGFAAAAPLASCAQPQPKPSARVLGANERINVAVAGIRSRGKNHFRNFAKLPNVHVKTLCDIDENLFADRVKEVQQIQGTPPSTEPDIRNVLTDKDIDAIAIASPNHWHALSTIWACQAGKHVYVEKPCSHNIWEGRKMIEAARKHNCLVQVGFQNRAILNVCQAMKFLHEGGIGDVYMARGLCFKPRESLGKCPDGYGKGEKYTYYVHGKPGPQYDKNYLDKVHYDLWLGPAPKKPFNYNRFHYNWHWNWNYGNGDIGNQGPHQFDVARWGMNKNQHPRKIRAFGGYYAFEDSAQETPNTEVATFEYDDGTIMEFEVRGLYTNREGDQDIRIGNLFYGTKGWMSLNGGTWKTYLGRNNKPGPGSQSQGPAADPMNLAGTGGAGIFKNFIDALRSGKWQDLACDIETGYMSTCLPHLANISYKLGREVIFDGKKEKFVNDKEADAMLKRVDGYRKPFVVPETV